MAEEQTDLTQLTREQLLKLGLRRFTISIDPLAIAPECGTCENKHGFNGNTTCSLYDGGCDYQQDSGKTASVVVPIRDSYYRD
ncbi:MAG: hypothetical protein ABIH82_01440 [Candidatus Woesearchaeota archaeon]